MGNYRIIRWAALLSILAAPSFAQAGKWWLTSMPYRIRVTLDTPQITNLPSEDIATVTFRTAGQTRTDGQDIRVTDVTGKELPRQIMQVGPGDMVRLAFATSGKHKEYYVYFGSKKTAKIAKKSPLKLRRGLRLEIWTHLGGNANRRKEFMNTITRAKQKSPRLGYAFRERIFSGVNPFGPQQNIVAQWTGDFLAPQDGEYEFGLSSQNASLVQVDGKPIVDWLRWHGPTRRLRRQGKIRLTKGLHRITVYHVSPWGNPVLVVMWRPPGKTRWELMPAGAFSPVAHGSPGPIERLGKSVNIDFSIVHAAEAFMANRYYQRRVFRAVHTGRPTKSLQWQWDFGDGQTATGQQVSHIFLRPGVYTITLRAIGHSGKLRISHKIDINRQWDKVTSHKVDPIAEYAKLVARYDHRRLPADHLFEACLLFRRTQNWLNLERFAQYWLTQSKTDDASLQKILPIYCDYLIHRNKPALAVAALDRAASKAKRPAVIAELLVQAAEITLTELHEPTTARQRYQTIIDSYAKHTTAPAIRQARIGLGDVFRTQGLYDKAQKAYNTAGIADPKAKKFPAIVKGDMARQVEDYLRRREYSAAEEALNRWATTLPADKLEGYYSLLKVQWLIDQKQYRPAAHEAETLVKVNPKSNYAPKLLLLAASAYAKNRQPEKAIAALKKIVQNYPESAAYPKAVNYLKKASGQPKK